MKICIAGKNSIAVNALDYILKLYAINEVCVVVNRNDDGEDSWQPSLKKAAKRNGVAIVALEQLYTFDNMIFISLEFDRILKPELFKKSARLYNIHFSLLPKYKGMYTSAWPILMNETNSGVTLHKIDAGIDTGDIIAQLSFPLDKEDTARDLYLKYLSFGLQLFCDHFNSLLTRDYKAIAQSIVDSTYFSKNSIHYANLEMNTKATAMQLSNQVKAFTFKEFQFPKVLGQTVFKCEIMHTRSKIKPGIKLLDYDDGFTMTTIDYDVRCYTKLDQLFWRAIYLNDIDAVMRLVSNFNLLELRSKEGWTPLMVAAYNHQKDLLKALINGGFDVNAINEKGTSVFMYAKDAAIKNHDYSMLTFYWSAGLILMQETAVAKRY